MRDEHIFVFKHSGEGLGVDAEQCEFPPCGARLRLARSVRIERDWSVMRQVNMNGAPAWVRLAARASDVTILLVLSG